MKEVFRTVTKHDDTVITHATPTALRHSMMTNEYLLWYDGKFHADLSLTALLEKMAFHYNTGVDQLVETYIGVPVVDRPASRLQVGRMFRRNYRH